MQECRPDTIVHTLVENAGSIQQIHLDFLARFLAIKASTHIPHYDPVGKGGQPAWSYAGRDRIFAATFPTPLHPPFPSLRPVPWEPGWGRRFDVPMPTIMTNREPDGEHRGVAPQPSTYQLRACFLLYFEDSWGAIPTEDIEAEVGRRLPPIHGLRDSWELLCRTGGRDSNEHGCSAIASWISQEGRSIGIRPPSLLERSRICGIDAWADELQLPPSLLWSAQGNFFDPAAIKVRLHGYIVPFLRGEIDLPRHKYVHPSFFPELFQHLRELVVAGSSGMDAVLSPFPPDLIHFPGQCDLIIAAFRASYFPALHPAAVDGRHTR